ncbi:MULTISPECIES: NUDIX domain-containing protein [Streptomyces]|uniref:NUDIX domain-containing protein n=4 Tax=Streptomyces TaxID=1883 RepID=A0A7Y6C623_9ACTN|nr:MULTISPECIES: NUDIX domain-containing protein [Streptomyces]MBL0778036.1 NUDIX domain-containing protein [Streptomyces albidoflavus]MCK2143410.1 NUDIX domain-containing protein [Streptomyces sp. WAC00276]NUV27715.1 NUDIX domain-containing protein [Streptomyces odorifer]NUV33448.1 NUDIX domain-containing protein [Streptomyces sp. KAI-27]
MPPMTLLAAAVIVYDRDAGRVVLLRRGAGAKYGHGLWDLPIGKCDPGEPVTEAAARELYEETGVTVRPEDLRVAHLVHGAWGVEAPDGYLTVVFAVERWGGEPENREPGKHDHVGWVPVGELPQEFVPGSAAALGEYLRGGGVGVSLRGWAAGPPPQLGGTLSEG